MSNKLLIAVFAVLLALTVGVYIFVKRCETPTEMQVLMTQLACAQEVITPDLRVKACQELGRDNECEFTDEDRPTIMALINRKVNECAKKRLMEQNYCTDTVKDL